MQEHGVDADGDGVTDFFPLFDAPPSTYTDAEAMQAQPITSGEYVSYYGGTHTMAVHNGRR